MRDFENFEISKIEFLKNTFNQDLKSRNDQETVDFNFWDLNRAEKSDFWKAVLGDLRQGDLNRFYPPCIVNAASDVLDG